MTGSPNFGAERPSAAAAILDPAVRSARNFRAALDAMARPGAPVRLPHATTPPRTANPAAAALSPAAAALLELLSDVDAPWWLASDRSDPATSAHLAFVTGAAAAARPERARFLCGGWAALAAEAVAAAAIGTADYPDRSATLIVEVEAVHAGPAADGRPTAATLEGPGLAAPARLAVDGVDAGFWSFVAANRARFPLGVDLYLTAGEQIVGLPRSVIATP